MTVSFLSKFCKYLSALWMSVLFLSSPCLSAEEGFVPPNGFVPTEEVAKEIAEAVLVPIYGEKQILDQKPFKTELKEGVWIIKGTLHQPEKGTRLGGVFNIKISQKTGEILYVIHYE